MKILILGAGGMLGSDVVEVLSNYDLIVADLPEWDITEAKNLKLKMQNCRPDLIINCAAFTDVSAAEEQKKLVFKVNAEGPLNLAKIVSKLDILLIQISTDYVFDGKKEGGYNEDDYTHPINVYGQSKEQAEKNIIGNCQKYYIVRTSWLFGRAIQKSRQNKKNFVDKMLELGQTQKVVKVIKDRFSKPTYTRDLAKSIKDIINSKPDFGIYHLVNEGVISWYGFAEEIFKQAEIDVKLEPITAREFFKNDIRPKNSALNNNKLPKLRSWQEALADYLKSKT